MSTARARTLPSGIVTFLVSDFEGWTGLLRSLGDSYADLLADHQRLLRAALARHDGVEYASEDDGMIAVFRRVTDALAAALEAQRALGAQPSAEDARLRVRMGVHVGDARVVDGEYRSLALHQCLRVAAAG